MQIYGDEPQRREDSKRHKKMQVEGSRLKVQGLRMNHKDAKAQRGTKR